MKKLSLVCTLILGLALALTSAFGQAQYFAPGNIGGGSDVQQFAQWSAHTTSAITSGSSAVQLDNCYFSLSATGQQFFPLAVGVKVTVLDAAGNSETDAITAISAPTPTFGSAQPGFGCGFTATFSNAHTAGVKIISGDGGLGEAISILKAFGGNVYVTSLSGITTSTITGLTVGAYNVGIMDISGANAAGAQFYSWNGTNYVLSGGTGTTVNGAGLVPFVCDSNVTLSLVATTTSVGGATCIPNNAFIIGVTGRVTTTITGACTGWEIGDATTAARFTVNNTGLTAGTKATNTTGFQSTAIAVAATGTAQAAAEALQITCAGGNPTAGTIRVTAVGFATIPSAQ